MSSVQAAVNTLPKGRYIVAVSGGVDSMALLQAMRQAPGLEIVAAHANHGIRADSGLDTELVAQFCRSHNIEYLFKELHLDASASENQARTARYDFLQHCRIKYNARAIVTAHHLDDLIETALINMLRGTGWRGLAPFVGNGSVVRPLINVSKQALIDYAKAQVVPWRADSTNTDQRYLRNYVRHTVRPYLEAQDSTWRDNFMRLIRKNQQLRRTIEAELDKYLTSIIRYSGEVITTQRYIWCMLPDPAAYEIFQQLCRHTMGNSIVRELAESALIFARTAKPQKTLLLNDQWQLCVTRRELIVEPRSSVVK